jgi:hypothetical protein
MKRCLYLFFMVMFINISLSLSLSCTHCHIHIHDFFLPHPSIFFLSRYILMIYLCSTMLLCAMLQVESIVLKRYGRDAYRMFRYLSKGKQFRPTDKVINSCYLNNLRFPVFLLLFVLTMRFPCFYFLVLPLI